MTKARDLASIPAGSGDFSVDSNTLFVDASADLVGIGTDNPSTALSQFGGNVVGATIASVQPAIALEDTTGPTYAYFGLSNNDVYIDNIGTGFTRFYTNGAERMRIDSSGHLIVPNGVTLGTAVGTYSAANTLDDYEEGTLTISTFSVVTGLTDVSHNYGLYTKIGNWVHIQGGLNITCSGTGRKAFVMNMPIVMHQNANVGQLGTVSAYPYATNNASGYILDNSGSNAHQVYVEFNVSNSAQTGIGYQLSYRTG